MSNTRSNRLPRPRPDTEIACNDHDVLLLRAVAAGRVVRGAGADTAINAPHLLDGQAVRLPLRRLAAEDLILMPISGPPCIAARGRRVLELANREIAAQIE